MNTPCSSVEINHIDYIRKIKQTLPREAFSPAPAKLGKMVGYLLLILGSYIILRFTDSLLVCVLVSLLIGNSLACLAFLTHELAHGAIWRPRSTRYALESFFWAFLLIPATVWRCVHNHEHHAHAGTIRDPDRAFLRSEESLITRWYTRFFYPNQYGFRWNPFVVLHLVPYVMRNVIAVFFLSNVRPSLVPAVPSYTVKQRLTVVSEILGICIIQIFIFMLVGGNWSDYLWASPIAFLSSSAVVMTYIFTNHFLNPLLKKSDPVLGTTSVIVPSIFDQVHSHFSLHTEHHLFPTINSDYYPLVSAALIEHFPERYSHTSLLTAWRRLWLNEDFLSQTPESEPTLAHLRQKISTESLPY